MIGFSALHIRESRKVNSHSGKLNITLGLSIIINKILTVFDPIRVSIFTIRFGVSTTWCAGINRVYRYRNIGTGNECEIYGIIREGTIDSRSAYKKPERIVVVRTRKTRIFM